MNEQDIMNKLKSDPRALKSVMQSQDGQTLLRMLSGGDSAALGRAAQQAAMARTSESVRWAMFIEASPWKSAFFARTRAVFPVPSAADDAGRGDDRRTGDRIPGCARFP